MKNVFVVIERTLDNQVFMKVTSNKELASKYVKEEATATSVCTIEEHGNDIIDTIMKLKEMRLIELK